MTDSTAQDKPQPASVTFPPAARAGVIGRFGGVDLVFFSVALVAAWIGLHSIGSGWTIPIVTAVICLLAVVLPLMPRVGGRRATDYIWPVIGAFIDRATGRGSYRGAVYAPASLAHNWDLPGDLAGFRMIEVSAADGHSRIALKYNKREKVALATALTFGGTLVTKDEADRALALAGWESVMTLLAGKEAGIRRFQLLARATTDTSNLAARHLRDKAVVRSGLVWQNAQALVTGPAANAPRHEVYVVLEYDLTTMSEELDKIDSKWGDQAIGAVIRDRLAEVEHALKDEGITTRGWLRPGQDAALIHTQFDPDSVPLHDMLAGPAADLEPRMAGPSAAERSWKYYRHDSGVSQTLWIHEMPGRPVHTSFLAPLLQDSSAHHSISIVSQPLDEATAQGMTEKQSLRADQAVTSRANRGLFVSSRAKKEAQAVRAQDQALADQDVMFRYLIFVTVTGSDEASCRRGVLAVRRSIHKAKCAAAVLYGEQDQAFFAGALPFARGLTPMRGRKRP